MKTVLPVADIIPQNLLPRKGRPGLSPPEGAFGKPVRPLVRTGGDEPQIVSVKLAEAFSDEIRTAVIDAEHDVIGTDGVQMIDILLSHVIRRGVQVDRAEAVHDFMCKAGGADRTPVVLVHDPDDLIGVGKPA